MAGKGKREELAPTKDDVEIRYVDRMIKWYDSNAKAARTLWMLIVAGMFALALVVISVPVLDLSAVVAAACMSLIGLLAIADWFTMASRNHTTFSQTRELLQFEKDAWGSGVGVYQPKAEDPKKHQLLSARAMHLVAAETKEWARVRKARTPALLRKQLSGLDQTADSLKADSERAEANAATASPAGA